MASFQCHGIQLQGTRARKYIDILIVAFETKLLLPLSHFDWISLSVTSDSVLPCFRSMTVEFETAADCNNAISSNATLKGRRVTIFLKGM